MDVSDPGLRVELELAGAHSDQRFDGPKILLIDHLVLAEFAPETSALDLFILALEG